MNLVVVESPTKAKTLARYLGEGFDVVATYGHVRDLPERKMGLEIKKNKDGVEFIPQYVVGKKQSERMGEIKKMEQAAELVYLATDPDREGEAIAWHTAELFESKRAGEQESKSKFRRIVFHEITKGAIMEALAHPRGIDMQLVNAQQARRVLDRLVGYKLSPLLWKKVRRGLSAGRVQSVTVKLVVEREREIEKFVAEEYWNIIVEVQKIQDSRFKIQLVDKVISGEQAERIEQDLRRAMYAVEKVEKKEFRRTPPAPFTTSTLQQAAANKLGWTAKKTMQVAQSLYEEGFITYHRTDSTNLADEAVSMVTSFLVDRYGKEYALDKPRFYKTKSKVAQEAHEAIRPTDLASQEVLLQGKRTSLNREQIRLYEMIWKRFVACQMAEVAGESMKISVRAGNYGLEAKGETIKFDGWYRIEQESRRVEEQEKLPEVEEGEKLDFIDLIKEQKFTQPPARYNDASLIKVLEEMGIGRPSTYAPTLSTIQDRQYVERIESKRFKPTPLGVAVNDFLVTNFPNIVDYEFTANMEYGLDEVAAGEKKWEPVVAEFYGPFEQTLRDVTDTAVRVKVEVETTGEKCPKCTSTGSAQVGDVVIRIGKFGRFLACSRYPECDYKANYQQKIGMACPKCQTGEVIVRKTRSRRNFFGCSNYPKCDFASWTKPQVQVQR